MDVAFEMLNQGSGIDLASTIVMPLWMLQNLGLVAGTLAPVLMRRVTVPKAEFIRIQPVDDAFVDDVKEMDAARALLESRLSRYTAVSAGDILPVRSATDESKVYFVELLEVRPAKVVSVNNCECNVDFAPSQTTVRRGAAESSSVDELLSEVLSELARELAQAEVDEKRRSERETRRRSVEIAAEPMAGAGVLTFRIQFPDGKKVTRRFAAETASDQVYAFAEKTGAQTLAYDRIVLRAARRGAGTNFALPKSAMSLAAAGAEDKSVFNVEEDFGQEGLMGGAVADEPAKQSAVSETPAAPAASTGAPPAASTGATPAVVGEAASAVAASPTTSHPSATAKSPAPSPAPEPGTGPGIFTFRFQSPRQKVTRRFNQRTPCSEVYAFVAQKGFTDDDGFILRVPRRSSNSGVLPNSELSLVDAGLADKTVLNI